MNKDIKKKGDIRDIIKGLTYVDFMNRKQEDIDSIVDKAVKKLSVLLNKS